MNNVLIYWSTEEKRQTTNEVRTLCTLGLLVGSGCVVLIGNIHSTQ